MQFTQKIEKKEQSIGAKVVSQGSIQVLQAHTYIFYFVAFLLGLFFDFIFSFKLLKQSITVPIGGMLIVLASFLILWAQNTSLVLKKKNLAKEALSKKTFCHGPYCYIRNPTHLGISILILGFGFLINATFVILFTVISFIATRFIFLRKEELMFAEKYGNPYLEYKKSVKF